MENSKSKGRGVTNSDHAAIPIFVLSGYFIGGILVLVLQSKYVSSSIIKIVEIFLPTG